MRGRTVAERGHLDNAKAPLKSDLQAESPRHFCSEDLSVPREEYVSIRTEESVTAEFTPASPGTAENGSRGTQEETAIASRTGKLQTHGRRPMTPREPEGNDLYTTLLLVRCEFLPSY